MFSKEYILKRRSTLAKNLKPFVQIGFIKDRGKERYTRLTAKYINCIGDACFALSNDDIKKYVCKQYVDKFCCPSPLATFDEKGKLETLNSIFDFLKETGLKITPCQGNEVLKTNQRKIAIYLSKAYDMPDADKKFLRKDVHCLSQKTDGTWRGKVGFQRKVKHFKTLPQTLPMEKDNPYILHGEFILTNPYATAYNLATREK